VTTVVRPTEADLIAISRRISGPLTAEGAEAWYRNDSAVLLQEIARLRREVEAARQSFLSDGAQAEPDATLYEWALVWKATATGFWQKAQTKTLREQLAAQRIAVANYKNSLAAAEDANRALVAEKAAIAAELAEVRQGNDELERKHEAERVSFLRRIGELDGLLAQARAEAVDTRSIAERNLDMLRARNDEQLAHARELMNRAMEAL
jgi:hypothetical protein